MSESQYEDVPTIYAPHSDLSMVPSLQDSDLTGDRNETQYRLPLESAEPVAAALSGHLPFSDVGGVTAGPLDSGQFVTTVYFDTPSRAIYHEGLQKAESLRLRARQYSGLALPPTIWLEIKHKRGIRSTKRRIVIPNSEIFWFFGAGPMTADLIRIRQRAHGEKTALVLQEIAAICEHYREPLQTDSVVHFKRIAWQDMRAGLRVTLDLELAFFPPAADLWTRALPLIREHLGPPLHRASSGVVEVKTRGELPSWLTALLTAAGVEKQSYSKFEEASRAVHD